jgi:hypothetical protein
MNIQKSNNESQNQCNDLIDLLESLVKKYKETTGGQISTRPDGRVHMSPIRAGINEKKVIEVLSEVLIEGKVKKIAESENQMLISKFYVTLQNLYIDLEKLSFGFTDEIKILLKLIRNSFAKTLPKGNITKAEIEKNIQIIHNQEIIKYEKQKLQKEEYKFQEEEKQIKEIINDNIIKIVVLLLGFALCYFFGTTVLLIYVTVICIVLFAGIISQLNIRSKNRKDKKLRNQTSNQSKIFPLDNDHSN